VITASERGERYRGEDQGVHLLRVRSRPNPFWTEGPIPLLGRKDLEAAIDKFRPDIIHSHDPVVLSLQLLRLGEDLAIPRLLTCQWLPRFVEPYLPKGRASRRSIHALGWKYSVNMVNQFDHVIFSSLTQRDAFAEHGLSVPNTIVSNGLDTTRYHPLGASEEDVAARYALPAGPRILVVGRLAKDKQIDVLIEAMSLVAAQREAHLLIVGRGDDRDRLEELARECQVEHCVRLMGFVPEEDLPALYRASDIYAIASACEVQSIPTLQAAATGLPIVAADAAALPELVRDGINGFLVPTGDHEAMGSALLRIASEPDLAAQMGRASLTIGQAHSETHTFDAYEGLYRRIAQPGIDDLA
jgi:glycosyltransferase involved in cell wall biosynthesis